MRLLGYTRVSTTSQDARLQLDALHNAGVEKRDVFSDVTSGSRAAIKRPGMKKLLEYASEGDTVVVWRIDTDTSRRPLTSPLRAAKSAIERSNPQALDRGGHFRLDPVDFEQCH